MIYFDNAATTLHKPREVGDYILKALQEGGNASRGATSESLYMDRLIYDTRKALQKLFQASHPRQVVFTKNSTEALNMVIKGTFAPRDHIITTDMEHNSVLRPLYELEKRGASISFLPLTERGTLQIDKLEGLLRPNSRALVVNHISNVTGVINDLAYLGEFCRKHNLLFIVDASQSAGAFPIRMEEWGIDGLCFTGHKSLYGPQGIGGLCVSERMHVRPLCTGGSGVESFSKEHPQKMPTALEAGTLNGHGIAGLRGALAYLEREGLDNLTERAQHLANRFYEGLSPCKGITFYGDFTTSHRAPIVSFTIDGHDSAEVSTYLSEAYGISTRPGAHCAPRVHETFHTEQTGMVRFSFSHTNREEEVHIAIRALKEFLGG